MKNGIIKKLYFFLIIFTLLTIISCSNTSKKITISENTENEISVEESETIQSITSGEKLLDEGRFEEAKEYFNKAISLDKTNTDTYLRIKDKYISINKLDEAYNIIKTAISNNVDIESMKAILKEISSKFEVTKLSNSVYQDGIYSLPKEINISLSGNSKSVPINWDNTIVDTSNIGTFTYEGYNDEFGRKVIIDLTVIENVYDKQIGCIKKIYTLNGKTYIDVDLVEFYLGHDLALEEAIKDDNAGINENGDYFLSDPYYIRNKYNKITTYEIINDCSLQLVNVDFLNLGYDINLEEKSSELKIASSKDFKAYIDSRNQILIEETSENDNTIVTDRSTLCWIEIKNDIAYSIYRQYTP
jgi:tetratricopeptide (TPR) repeat protein